MGRECVVWWLSAGIFSCSSWPVCLNGTRERELILALPGPTITPSVTGTGFLWGGCVRGAATSLYCVRTANNSIEFYLTAFYVVAQQLWRDAWHHAASSQIRLIGQSQPILRGKNHSYAIASQRVRRYMHCRCCSQGWYREAAPHNVRQCIESGGSSSTNKIIITQGIFNWLPGSLVCYKRQKNTLFSIFSHLYIVTVIVL